ncbi:MAG: hypothetical protein VYA30_09850 [Myxococcota bacterium]|nr:hypothetical protein [Myxococcota bacterium]
MPAPVYIVLLGLLGLSSASWSKVSSRGEIVLSSRVFSPDSDTLTKDQGLALATELESRGRHGPVRHQVRLFGRVAAFDEDRSVVFFKDAWVGYKNPYLEFKVGPQVLNWTATEAFHPADIINSRNLDSDFENAEKLGEPIASIRLRFLNGGLTAYAMPIRISPLFPGQRSRLNLTEGAALGDGLWMTPTGTLSSESWGAQWALRLDQTIGSADFAVHVVQHNDRTQPAIVADPQTGLVQPVYGRVDRLGLTYTQAIGEWLMKLEVDHRMFDELMSGPRRLVVRDLPVDHTAVAVGAEWGWGYQLGHEGTLILESQFAVTADSSASEMSQLGPFQRDGLIGYRHTWNDTAGTEMMLGAIFDLQRASEFLGTLSLSRRISDVWRAKLGMRAIRAPEQTSLLNAYHNLYSAQLDITRYF